MCTLRYILHKGKKKDKKRTDSDMKPNVFRWWMITSVIHCMATMQRDRVSSLPFPVKEIYGNDYPVILRDRLQVSAS